MKSLVRLTSVTTKDGGQSAHEGGLSTTGISGNTDNNGSLTGLEGHVEAGGRGLGGSTNTHAIEGLGGGEGRDGRDGGEGEGDLHGWSYWVENCCYRIKAEE